jgi:hypothetical protein
MRHFAAGHAVSGLRPRLIRRIAMKDRTIAWPPLGLVEHEPIVSVTGLLMSAAATRAGMMTGMLAFGLPIASITNAYGRDNSSTKLRSSNTLMFATALIIRLPNASFLAHRRSDTMQSSGVTGAPSCHVRPDRNVSVQFSRSSLTRHDSSICGWNTPLESIATSVS